MSKAHRLVPVGEYCYRWDAVLPGDVATNGADGRWLGDRPQGEAAREFFSEGSRRKTVRCLFWRQTDHGTVRCELTGREEWDLEDSYRAAIEDSGAEAAHRIYPPPGDLQDEIKTCGVNTIEQVYEEKYLPDGVIVSAVHDWLDREVAQPPGPVLNDVSVGQFVWHSANGFGLVTERHDDLRGLGHAALVLFRAEIGEETVLLSARVLHDDPLPRGAAPPAGGDPLEAAFASIPSRLAAD